MLAEPIKLSVIPVEILTRCRDAWAAAERTPERALLRLDILRGLVRAVHAERSRCLATAKMDDGDVLERLEHRLESLLNVTHFDEATPFDALLGAGREHASSPKPASRPVLPPALLEVLGNDRLTRYDRKWEATLASLACPLGWKFWRLDAWVEIPRAEEWNTSLTRHLWPSGIVLFVESASLNGVAAASRTTGPVPLPLWPGRWTIIAHPGFTGQTDLIEKARLWPGYPPSPPDLPGWKLLFAPKSG